MLEKHDNTKTVEKITPREQAQVLLISRPACLMKAFGTTLEKDHKIASSPDVYFVQGSHRLEKYLNL